MCERERAPEKVLARFKGRVGGMHAGTIVKMNTDGTYKVKFDNGDTDEKVKANHIERR